jgi:hypothetical protein
MTNDDIRVAVSVIVAKIVKVGKIPTQDKPVLDAAVLLITNVLQNLNDIAEGIRIG